MSRRTIVYPDPPDPRSNITALGQGQLRVQEDGDNGINSVGFKAPTSIGNDVTWTLPSTDGSSGEVLTTDGTVNLSWGAGGGGQNPYSYIQDQKPTNTDSGNFVGAVWQPRTLNTEVNTYDPNNDITPDLVNKVTLTAGTWKIWARAPAFNSQNITNYYKTRWQNIDDGTTAVNGGNAFLDLLAGVEVQTDSICMGSFTIGGTKTFQLQHQSKVTINTHGFGRKYNLIGVPEIYAQVYIEKVA
jgi:hypothetical protein